MESSDLVLQVSGDLADQIRHVASTDKSKKAQDVDLQCTARIR
jgi:hypothetical protein